MTPLELALQTLSSKLYQDTGTGESRKTAQVYRNLPTPNL
jgi:hypothetical protein